MSNRGQPFLSTLYTLNERPSNGPEDFGIIEPETRQLGESGLIEDPEDVSSHETSLLQSQLNIT
jgi:hypothetical protein